jgi:hypothetical protein
MITMHCELRSRPAQRIRDRPAPHGPSEYAHLTPHSDPAPGRTQRLCARELRIRSALASRKAVAINERAGSGRPSSNPVVTARTVAKQRQIRVAEDRTPCMLVDYWKAPLSTYPPALKTRPSHHLDEFRETSPGYPPLTCSLTSQEGHQLCSGRRTFRTAVSDQVR